MLEEKDLQAIAQMMDLKLAQQKESIMSETKGLLAQQKQELLDVTTQRMKVLLDTEVSAAEQRIAKSTVALMDAEFSKRFDLLADGLQDIQQKLIPMSRIEALEDDVSLLKQVIRSMSKEIAELKKAQ